MKKNICFIDPKFLRSIGGVETHGYEFVKNFISDKEYKIESIISLNEVTDGINLKIENKKFESLTKRILTKNIEKDAKLILNNSSKDTEIYFFNNPNWILTSKKIKGNKPNSKIFVRSGGNDIPAGWILDENDKSKKLKENREKIIFYINNYVDKLIVNSKYSKKRMIELGIKRSKIKIVTGGVDCELFTPRKNVQQKSRKIKIIFWGRLVKFKGLEYSLKALSEVYKKNREIEFIIIGDGPERENILDLISKSKLNEIISYRGIKEFNKIPKEAKDADIFLHLPIYQKKYERGSSYIHTETMGRTYCEASSLGIPSVVSNVGGSPEMIKNNSMGYVVEEKDYIHASKKILKLIKNKRIRDKMSEKSRKIALKRYDWINLINKYKRIF